MTKRISELPAPVAVSSADTFPGVQSGTTRRVTAALLRDYISPANATAFGAVGDGITDDTTAIQAAIDSLGAQGGIVSLPVGKFLISSALKYPADDDSDFSFTLAGAGPGATKIIYSGTGWAIDTVAVGATNTGNMTLRDFALVGTSAAASGGIRLKNVHRSHIHDIQISGFTHASSVAILLDGSGGASFGAHHNLLERLDISAVMSGIKLTGSAGAGQSNGNRIIACRIGVNQINGIGINIDIGDTNAAYGTNVYGSADPTTAIRIADIRNEITDCRIEFDSGSLSTVGVVLTAAATDSSVGPVSIANAASAITDATTRSYLRRLTAGIERSLAGAFYSATVTINGTTNFGQLGGVFADVPRIIMPVAGSVAAVSWRFTTAPTAGNYDVRLTRGGADVGGTGNQGTANTGAVRFLPGEITFTTAQGMGINVVTDAAFLTGAKLTVWLWVYI